MRANLSTCQARAWAVFMLPALSLFFTGLLLHPMDPAEALGLLQANAIEFLLKAGLAARIPLLLAAGLLLPAVIGPILACCVRRRERLRYHSGLPTSNPPHRFRFQ